MDTLINRQHQVGDNHLLQGAQVLKTRRLQGEPVQRRIAIIRSRLAGTGHTPELLRLAVGLAVPGRGALHIRRAVA